MTNIRLIYDPFYKKVKVYWEDREIAAAENKLHTFLESRGFLSCLLPFRQKYVIWNGLLPELIQEVNDDELHIIFEGRESDFRQVEEAFGQSENIICNMGYENKWALSYMPNFNKKQLEEQVESILDVMEEIAESRNELRRLKEIKEKLLEGKFKECLWKAEKMTRERLDYWKDSSSKYREEKINYINSVIMSRLKKAKEQLRHMEKEGE